MPRNLAVVPEQTPQPRRLADRLFGAVTPAPEARPPQPRPEAPRSVRQAAVVVAVEAAVFVVLAAVLMWLTLTGDPESVPRALAEVVLVGGVAALLGAAAMGLRRLAGWARGPVIALRVRFRAWRFVALQAGCSEFGVPAHVMGVAAAYLLMTPEAGLAYLDH